MVGWKVENSVDYLAAATAAWMECAMVVRLVFGRVDEMVASLAGMKADMKAAY